MENHTRPQSPPDGAVAGRGALLDSSLGAGVVTDPGVARIGAERISVQVGTSEKRHGRRSISNREAIALFMKGDGRCGICDQSVQPEVLVFDHIIPVIRGGADVLENLQIAHDRCNARKNALILGRNDPLPPIMPKPVAILDLPSDEAGWLKPEEAARELGVPARTVHYWLASKWLHGRNIRGRIWLIAPSEVERVKQIGRPRRGPPKGTRRPPPPED